MSEPKTTPTLHSVTACPWCASARVHLSSSGATAKFTCGTMITRYMADSRHLQSVHCCHKEREAIEAEAGALRKELGSNTDEPSPTGSVYALKNYWKQEADLAMEEAGALRDVAEKAQALVDHMREKKIRTGLAPWFRLKKALERVAAGKGAGE